jgi:prephenate dehydrogenase
MFNKVAIVGLGLVGGSMGLALRKAQAAQQVAGYDLGRGVSERARKIGAIDQPYYALADAVRGAELIILATPVGTMRALLQDIATMASPGAVVTDVASTKVQIISWAQEYLPAAVSFVGGHPMVGKQVIGVEAADAALFQDRIYCLTPTRHTPSAALNKVSMFVEVLGARVRFLESAEHDGQVAGVSQLPYVVAVALMSVVAGGSAWGDAAMLADTGFNSMTRLAASNPEMNRDICLTNSEALTRWLNQYITELAELRDRIAAHDSNLDQKFARVQQLRQQWQASYDIEE